MIRITVPFIAILSLVVFVLPARAEEIAPRIRYSVTPETVRVVLDCPAEAVFTDHSTPTAITLAVAMPLADPLPAITVTDPIVTGITLNPDETKQAVLTITLAKARKYNLFCLTADQDHPFRVVVDVLKRFTRETHQSLSRAITYTRLETQTDDRYQVAHLLDINARDSHIHFAVVPANGLRERVCEMVTRTSAICGVNGGFFMEGTRPVGLVKAEGRILSLPLWGRTAAAFPRTGAPVFDNPHGSWRLTLPDNTTRDLPDWLDASILTPLPTALIVNGDQFRHAQALPTGLTLLIEGDKVVSHTTAALPLTAGQRALQLRGDDVKALGDLLPDGTPVKIAPVLQPDWKDYPNAVGAGPRLLRNGKIDINGLAEHLKPDILLGHHARTGLGVTAKGHVLMAIVEAPGLYGGGASLDEFAALLQEHGAVDAMNLDGGGSTTLAFGPDTVNASPGDWVRPVACGVLVTDDRVEPINYPPTIDHAPKPVEDPAKNGLVQPNE